MSTHALIASYLGSSKYDSIYLHFDGYPNGAGRTLSLHYSTKMQLDQLIELGNLISLGADLNHGDTKAYHRDRGEPFNTNIPRLHLSFTEMIEWAELLGCEHVYLFYLGDWRHWDVLNNKSMRNPVNAPSLSSVLRSL